MQGLQLTSISTKNLKIRREDRLFDTFKDTNEDDSFDKWEYCQEQDKMMNEILVKKVKGVI